MKKFKSFYKMALPLLTIAATATAIPLAACSNSKKDDVKTLKLTLNDGNKDITGNSITIEYGKTKTYSIKSVMYGTTDLTSTAQIQFVFNSVTYLNFTDNQDGTFTLANTNDSGSEVSTTLGVVVTDEATGLNQTVEYMVLGNSDTVAQVTITVGGSDYSDGRTITISNGRNQKMGISNLQVNGSPVEDGEWQVEWALAEESQANSQYVQINNQDSKTECTVVNNNTTQSSINIKVEAKITCADHGFVGELVSVVNFELEGQTQPIEGSYTFATIVGDDNWNSNVYDEEQWRSHMTTSSNVVLGPSNFKFLTNKWIKKNIIFSLYDSKNEQFLTTTSCGNGEIQVKWISKSDESKWEIGGFSEGNTITLNGDLHISLDWCDNDLPTEAMEIMQIEVCVNPGYSDFGSLPEECQTLKQTITFTFDPNKQ